MAGHRKIEKSPLFRGLHFKFAAAFVAVVLAAWFVTLMLTGIFDYWNLREEMKSVGNFERAQKQSSEILDYLKPESRNSAAVRWWLEAYREKIVFYRRAHAADLYYFSSPEVEALDNSIYLRVTDADGNLIVVNRALAEAAATDYYDALEAELWTKITAGEIDGRNLTAVHADGAVSIAVPLRDAQTGDLRGALWLREKSNFTAASAVQKMISDFLSDSQSALAILILSSVLFGFPLALYISRRLSRIALAAHSWSQGDFTVRAADKSADELGILAKRLNEMAKDLSAVFALKQELAASEERNRIARDLHDSVKQQVFGLAMQISAAQRLIDQDDGAAAKTRLLEAKKLAQTVQSELVGLITELRPMPENGGDFAAHLHKYAEDWARQNAIAANISINQKIAASPAIETAFFRIAQEALANIARHSNAQKVSIHLVAEAENLTLSIADNGSGFDPQTINYGFGLQNIRERAAALPNGKLEIESAAGSGTRLIITCRTNAGETLK